MRSPLIATFALPISLLASCENRAPHSSSVTTDAARAESLTPQAVTWGNLVNASANGGTLTKTSGCDGCDDAGGAAQPMLSSGSGYIEFATGNPSAFM